MADKDNNNRDGGNRRRMTLMERLGERLDIPADVLTGVYLEMRGRRNLVVKGCRKILLYTTVEVRLLLGKDRLSVCGAGLYCTAYHSGVVEIDGRIDRISFLDERGVPEESDDSREEHVDIRDDNYASSDNNVKQQKRDSSVASPDVSSRRATGVKAQARSFGDVKKVGEV